MKSLFVFLAIVAVAFCATPYKDCGSSEGTITGLQIITDGTPCNAAPCTLKKGTTAGVQLDFTANAAISNATTSVYGLIGPIKVPFPLPDQNACNFMSCPVASGASVTYKYEIEVKKEYPATNVIIQWELHSSSGMITCFQVPAVISE